MTITVAIVTISDSSFEGTRESISDKVIRELVTTRLDARIVAERLVPDDPDAIGDALIEVADQVDADLVLTTGGTGMSPRDNTPEATRSVIEREVPGIPEAMRVETSKHTMKAYLSRGIAGIRAGTLIINLPGSRKAVAECLEVVLPLLPHSVEIIRGTVHRCGG